MGVARIEHLNSRYRERRFELPFQSSTVVRREYSGILRRHRDAFALQMSMTASVWHFQHRVSLHFLCFKFCFCIFYGVLWRTSFANFQSACLHITSFRSKDRNEIVYGSQYIISVIAVDWTRLSMFLEALYASLQGLYYIFMSGPHKMFFILALVFVRGE